MKRKAGDMESEVVLSLPNKKPKIDEATGTNQSVSLPSEIWKLITSYAASDCDKIEAVLHEQTSLALSSKNMNKVVRSLWREESLKLWPKFYTNVLALMKSKEGIATYKKLRIFGSKKIDEEDLKSRYFALKCPLCASLSIKRTNKSNEIITCTNCVQKHGPNWTIEWKINYKTINCSECRVGTPSKLFECDGCRGTYCKNCKKMKFRSLVYGDEDSSYCTKCAVDCHHCADWGTLVKSRACSRCNEPRCERCYDVGHCDNEPIVDSDEDEEDEENEEEEEDEESSEELSNEQEEELEDLATKRKRILSNLLARRAGTNGDFK